MPQFIITCICCFFVACSTIGAQQLNNETIFHDGLNRSYLVYVPDSYNPDMPAPLLFNFHGFGGNSNQQLDYADMRPIADTAGFILVYPQGSLFFGIPHWSVGSWTGLSTADDVGFTEAMIDALSEEYSIDSTRIYSCGFSNGGYFSFVLACELSDRIAAVGSVGGVMSTQTYDACMPVHPVPVISIHGTDDGVVAYNGGNPFNSHSVEVMLDYWVNQNGLNPEVIETEMPDINSSDNSTVTYQRWESDDDCATVEHYRVNNGSHSWPLVGGNPANRNADISASQLIWDFVSKYDLDGPISCVVSSTNKVAVLEKQLKAFPNPTERMVSIATEQVAFSEHYVLFNAFGQSVKNGSINSTNDQIDLGNLPTGTYILVVGQQRLRIVKQ